MCAKLPCPERAGQGPGDGGGVAISVVNSRKKNKRNFGFLPDLLNPADSRGFVFVWVNGCKLWLMRPLWAVKTVNRCVCIGLAVNKPQVALLCGITGVRRSWLGAVG